jgi:hypothetical protein
MARSLANGDIGVVEWSYSACQPVLGLKPTAERKAKLGSKWHCTEFNEWAHTQLAKLPGDVPVVIIGRYAEAAMGPNEDQSLPDRPQVYFSETGSSTTPQFLDEFAAHITRSACSLAKQRTVYLLRPIPEIGVHVPKALSRRMAWGIREDISIPIQEYRKRNGWVWAAQDAAREDCGIKILDPTEYLCDRARCFGSRNLRPLYADDDHLSEFGNALLSPMFAEISRAMNGQQADTMAPTGEGPALSHAW